MPNGVEMPTGWEELCFLHMNQEGRDSLVCACSGTAWSGLMWAIKSVYNLTLINVSTVHMYIYSLSYLTFSSRVRRILIPSRQNQKRSQFHQQTVQFRPVFSDKWRSNFCQFGTVNFCNFGPSITFHH